MARNRAPSPSPSSFSPVLLLFFCFPFPFPWPPPSPGFSPHPRFNHRRDPLPSLLCPLCHRCRSSTPSPPVPSLPLSQNPSCPLSLFIFFISTEHHLSPLPPPPPPLSPTTPPQPLMPLSCFLSLSLLLDPPSASLHCVFHRRSPPQSPPLSTISCLPLLPPRCTPISATMIVTTPASPLPSPSVVAIFRPRRPPASLLRRHRCRRSQPPPSPLFRALPFPPPPLPPSILPLRSPRPSATVDATTATSAPPSSSSHRLRPCLPAAVSLLPPPIVRIQAALPLLLPASVAVSRCCRHLPAPR